MRRKKPIRELIERACERALEREDDYLHNWVKRWLSSNPPRPGDLKGICVERIDLLVNINVVVLHDLSSLNFSERDLTNAYLYAILENAKFHKSKLGSAELRGIYSNAIFDEADLTEATLTGDFSFCNMQGCVLDNANAQDTDFSYSDLRNASLRNTRLSGATLIGTDLSGADLRGADLARVDLSSTTIRGADLRDADLTNTVFRDHALSTNLQGVRFNQSMEVFERNLDVIGGFLRFAAVDGVEAAVSTMKRYFCRLSRKHSTIYTDRKSLNNANGRHLSKQLSRN